MSALFIEPTIAMHRGDTVVDQCSECGAMVAHDQRKKLGRCPACDCPHQRWWRQGLPVGPFNADEAAA